MVRMVLVFVFIKLFLADSLASMIAACFVFAAAAITDYLDGYIAKKYDLITDFGKIMDPIADKFLMLAAFYLFAKFGLIPMWMFIVIAVREVGITVMRLIALKRKEVLAAENLGKMKTVSQIVVISVILIYVVLKKFNPTWRQDTGGIIGLWIPVINLLMYISVGLTVISGAQFLHNLKKD
ncbi:MAG: CDP-diacylglycerol--glycerol-3-phosphate 3-phosphatidyltransferase [Candidatus Omnitrophica bacterium]|nr:CDP-diacylglycerol--glycerol-3-phosphate 3-phosphatidyltransferase [Candidatus Omnitrophota bacterium]MBU1997066.1 CDP-diacylglycerol--glycerol-3-phosphate 3-phosphatidyltransferase [Candidatus Omnitrophota bacterium]